MTDVRGLALALALAATLMPTLGGVALADHLRAICDVTAEASAKVEQGYVLAVRLRTSDGRPVNETAVRFYETVDFFGRREMYLGAATTDGQGNTSLVYLPAQLGAHEIVARSAGHDHFTAAEGRTTFEATVAAADHQREPAPLAAFSAALPYAVGLGVLAVWALLAYALIGTARGVLGGARDLAQKKGDLA